ncbi:predicted protein [Phaeodactylum tricornutum CCAP 1055/1]|uniref:Fe2OG dioxygenase domain-containing protein n=1 Tax=Phaeodactylum tricornutum (strain CCAP 1055/1) TaxID=556484 RepID=B7FU32_PHATC|nr:predicted protein [Phaeodactylum tricornutum CCAP 1055/1]EEC49911.1 predicted protein [Phaeodactylum tricornutum CCAP 1055/1]|eukprot:XP_002178246.1 predicted protein [Phaeodactylum tricornutum CCAP 1055/1]
MGLNCSKCAALEPADSQISSTRQESPDPAMYDLMRRSVEYTSRPHPGTVEVATPEKTTASTETASAAAAGQFHLLYKQQHKTAKLPHELESLQSLKKATRKTSSVYCPTRLLVRRHSVRHYEEGMSGTHIYAIRYPIDKPLELRGYKGETTTVTTGQEQAPHRHKSPALQQQQKQLYNSTATSASVTTATNKASIAQSSSSNAASSGKKTTPVGPVEPASDKWPALKDNPEQGAVDQLFNPITMLAPPKRRVAEWVTISSEHNIYVADVGLTIAECDRLVQVTEQVCRGQYAAYTYAKQTLGCREFPPLAHACQDAVHAVTHAILEYGKNSALALDDREPHMVKYDVTKKERQKLDMHTDKSEWTFLIALSNGSGLDYEGGGTFFECLDSTVHVQRGHALIFPGKLRHCGQRITSGLRFLLVGFLVDKSTPSSKESNATQTTTSTKEDI